MQRLGRLSQIKVTPRGLLDKAKLVQVHILKTAKNWVYYAFKRQFLWAVLVLRCCELKLSVSCDCYKFCSCLSSKYLGYGRIGLINTLF
jgi:hypothetical protein